MRTTGSPPVDPGAGAFRLTLTRQIIEALLQPRRVHLRHRQARTAYVRRLREDVVSGRAKPVDMLLALSLADVEDGAPIEAVTRPYALCIALLEEAARAREIRRPAAELSLLPLHQRETRAQAALDESQQWACAEPDNTDALAAVDRAAAQYEAEEARLLSAVRRRLARLSMRSAS